MTENKSSNEFQGNLRYINWWSGPQYPKVWGTEDYNELAQAKEKGYIFARKFDSSFVRLTAALFYYLFFLVLL